MPFRDVGTIAWTGKQWSTASSEADAAGGGRRESAVHQPFVAGDSSGEAHPQHSDYPLADAGGSRGGPTRVAGSMTAVSGGVESVNRGGANHGATRGVIRSHHSGAREGFRSNVDGSIRKRTVWDLGTVVQSE